MKWRQDMAKVMTREECANRFAELGLRVLQMDDATFHQRTGEWHWSGWFASVERIVHGTGSVDTDAPDTAAVPDLQELDYDGPEEPFDTGELIDPCAPSEVVVPERVNPPAQGLQGDGEESDVTTSVDLRLPLDR
jgi:hypothetical protein